MRKETLSILLCIMLFGTAIGQVQDSTLNLALDEEIVACDSLADELAFFTIAEITDQLDSIENKVPLTYNGYTGGFINYFTVRKRSYIRTMQERKELFFPMFEKKLKEAGIPDELKYLSIVESGLNPRARSNAGAVGLWQFIPSTGRMMGLKVDKYFDERYDPEKATEAACKYLLSLYNKFGDWRYAIAAYNCGPGNVSKARRKSGYSKDFWKVYKYLPRETRGYVPQFMAIMYAMKFNEMYNLYPDKIEFLPEYEVYEINEYCNLDTLCKMLDLCFEDVQKLNGTLKFHYIPAGAEYELKLPSEASLDFISRNCEIMDSCRQRDNVVPVYVVENKPSGGGKQKIVHRVKSGEYLGKIANRYGVSIRDLRKWNGISGNTIRIGQRITVWKGTNYSPPAQSVAKNTNPIPMPNSKTHIVQPGDTLWDISRKYKDVTPEQLKRLNNLKDNKIKPGQKLILG